MFCLFKNSHLTPKVNFFVAAIAWVAALAWLNFTFIEKEFVFKVMAGEAILLDLLLGIPLVLMLAIVVYATIFWFLKLIIVYLFPRAIAPASSYDSHSALLEDPALEETLQNQYGENYWQKNAGSSHSEDLLNGSSKEKDSITRVENQLESQSELQAKSQVKTENNTTIK